MKKKIKNNIRDVTRYLLGKKWYNYFRFFLTHHYIPDIRNPKSFSEKIMYRKLCVEPEIFSKLVDKFTVRDFVEEKIGNQYLTPIYLVTKALSVKDLEKLPISFVIKTTHGGGGNNVLVVNDKSEIDFISVINRFNYELSIKMGEKVDELFYDIESPKIIIESLLKNDDLSPLLDYKFHVFRNKGSIHYLLQINSEYNTPNCKKTLYNIDGTISDIQFSGYKKGNDNVQLPDNFNEMIKVVDLLSCDFEYVRIDLFNVNGNIYFGEMTFCPASGWDKINSKDNDFKLGAMWG
ncbi:ATP-grasp fold amidoligase family protein [Photobacterium damselae]